MAMTFATAVAHALGTGTGTPTATLTGVTIDASWEYLLLHITGAKSSGTTAVALTAATITDGTNTLTLTIPTGGTNYQTYTLGAALSWHSSIAHARMSAATPGALSTSAGACTITCTYDANVGNCTMGLVGLNMGTSASSPFRALEYITTGDAATASITHASMPVQQDGVAVICEWNSNTSATFATSSGFTEVAGSDAAVNSRRLAFQYQNIAADGSTAPVIDPSTDQRINSYLVWFKEVNDAALTSAATSPYEPGETVAFTGTAMDVSGAGARIRKVGGTSSYDAMGTPSSVTSTTFSSVIPNRPTRTPYTSEDGTTHTIEFIATTSGVVTGTATTALTTNEFVPPSGYSRVTITSPDLTVNSLLYYLGWTSIAGDQIEWDNAVNVSGTDVTITVNTDGTVTLDSGANPMPASVPFYWRAYSTGDEQWTGSASNQSDWATATFGEGGVVSSSGSAGPIRSAIRSPIRSAVRGTIH